MTAIVGLVHEGTVIIGGDSAGVSGYSLTVRADQKVFAAGPYVMGFTSSFRMGQLLRWAFEPPAPDTEQLEKFMATTFVDAVRETLKAGGWLRKDSDQEEGGLFLVGVAGRLFTIAQDFQVGEAADGYAAAGCGDDVAVGALYATEKLGLSPGARLTTALLAAERFSAGVRGPFTLVRTPD